VYLFLKREYMFLLSDGHSNEIFECDLPELQTSGKKKCREEIDLLLKNEMYPKKMCDP
jgi:hypothetical protein